MGDFCGEITSHGNFSGLPSQNVSYNPPRREYKVKKTLCSVQASKNKGLVWHHLLQHLPDVAGCAEVSDLRLPGSDLTPRIQC